MTPRVFKTWSPTQFNSYRLSYRYRLYEGERWTWWTGFTAKVRDAKIELGQGAITSRKTDLGFVPLLHVHMIWRGELPHVRIAPRGAAPWRRDRELLPELPGRRGPERGAEGLKVRGRPADSRPVYCTSPGELYSEPPPWQALLGQAIGRLRQMLPFRTARSCSIIRASPSARLLPGLMCTTILAIPAEAGPATDRAVAAALEGYVHLARGVYAAAVREVESLRTAVHRLLERPSPATLAQARVAWIASRDPYGRSEVYRFSGGPIDDRNPVTHEMGPEGRINAWPVDEAFLDYVAGSRRGGLIGDLSAPLSEETLANRHGTTDETEVTLGFHAIEFLLWGQDLDPEGPGQRPYADFLPGDPIRDRRRACLSLLVAVLARDLGRVAQEWEPGPRRHADRFRAMDPREALGHALSGPATLAGFELAAERIGVPLSSGSQEDEHSCFSDNTHRDIVANLEGIALVLEGDGREPGLLSAIDAVDPVGAAVIGDQLERARRLAYTVEPPFDAVLTVSDDDPRRRHLRALAGELIGLATAIQRSGAAAGAKVVIGGGG